MRDSVSLTAGKWGSGDLCCLKTLSDGDLNRLPPKMLQPSSFVCWEHRQQYMLGQHTGLETYGTGGGLVTSRCSNLHQLYQ